MERRSHTRFPANHPAILTLLSDPAGAIPVSVRDVSEGGVRLSIDETCNKALEHGDFVQLDIEDAALFGEIRYREGLMAGVRIERALIGDSDLSRLIEKLLAIPVSVT